MTRMITTDMIEDLAEVKVPASRKLFYMWLVLQFGHNVEFTYEDCMEFGKSKRTLFRYVKDLDDLNMVTRKGKEMNGTPGIKTVISLN